MWLFNLTVAINCRAGNASFFLVPPFFHDFYYIRCPAFIIARLLQYDSCLQYDYNFMVFSLLTPCYIHLVHSLTLFFGNTTKVISSPISSVSLSYAFRQTIMVGSPQKWLINI